VLGGIKGVVYSNGNATGFHNRFDFGSRQQRDLDKAAATTLGIDFLKALLFLSLFDNTERSDEETQNDCHVSVNGRKSVFQRIVCEQRYGCNTEVGRNVDGKALRECGVLAEVAPDLSVGHGEVAAAMVLVLNSDPVRRRQRSPLLLELVTLPQGKEPDHAANDDDSDRVHDEEPVEDDEAECDVVPLHDRPQRHHKCQTQYDPQDHASSEEFRRYRHIHQNVGSPPYN